MDPLLKTLQEEVRASAAAFSPEQLIWHPAGKWSASAILEHLYPHVHGNHEGLSAGSRCRQSEGDRGDVEAARRSSVSIRVQLFAVGQGSSVLQSPSWPCFGNGALRNRS